MKLSLCTLFLLCLSFTAFAQSGKVAPNSKVFLAPSDSGLHTFLAAEIVKKKLPLVIVTEESAAEYVLAGTSLKADDKWYHTVFGGKDKNEGSVQLLDVKTKTMVWAGEAGDRSLWKGGWSRGGQRKVADRLINQMKKDLFK